MSFSDLLKKFSIGILICLGLAVPAFALDTTKTTTATSSTTRKDLMVEKTQIKKDFLQARAAAIQSLKEKMATREAALKLKLQAFRDQKKATVAQRVSTNLNDINSKRNDQMAKALTKMSEILTKLETRVNSGSPDIKNKAAAQSAIADAKTAIAAAQDAVTAQSQKDYTLTISTEAKAKLEAQTMRNQLETDLKTTRGTVIAAKKAVSTAIRIAKSGSSQVKESTSSGQ